MLKSRYSLGRGYGHASNNVGKEELSCIVERPRGTRRRTERREKYLGKVKGKKDKGVI